MTGRLVAPNACCMQRSLNAWGAVDWAQSHTGLNNLTLGIWDSSHCSISLNDLSIEHDSDLLIESIVHPMLQDSEHNAVHLLNSVQHSSAVHVAWAFTRGCISKISHSGTEVSFPGCGTAFFSLLDKLGERKLKWKMGGFEIVSNEQFANRPTVGATEPRHLNLTKREIIYQSGCYWTLHSVHTM